VVVNSWQSAWLQWCAEIWLLTCLKQFVLTPWVWLLTPFEKTDLLLCNDWLYAQNVMPCLQCECVAGCCVIGGWACHSGGMSDCLCTAGRFVAQSRRRAVSEYSAVLVVKADMRCATSVRVHKRAVADYSGKFPRCISYIFLHWLISCNLFSYFLICV